MILIPDFQVFLNDFRQNLSEFEHCDIAYIDQANLTVKSCEVEAAHCIFISTDQN